VTPHPRHDFFLDDPTHVRPVTPDSLKLFSQALNRECIAKGGANSLLALYLGVDFELQVIRCTPSSHWFRLHPGPVDHDLIMRESAIYSNLIEQIEMTLKVVK